jgi:hypothetical protein
VDFPVWVSRLNKRDRRLISRLIRDERTKDVARAFSISPDYSSGWPRSPFRGKSFAASIEICKMVRCERTAPLPP